MKIIKIKDNKDQFQHKVIIKAFSNNFTLYLMRILQKDKINILFKKILVIIHLIMSIIKFMCQFSHNNNKKYLKLLVIIVQYLNKM